MSSEIMMDGDMDAVASPATPVSALAPGAILRAERERNGYSIADVAQVIRFSPRQVEYLENDEYDRLPGITAVRGFVRGYAKFLKIDPVPLLAALEPAAPAIVMEIRPPANMGEAEKVVLVQRVSPRLIASGFLVLAVIAVVGVLGWLISTDRLPFAMHQFSLSGTSTTQPGSQPESATPPITSAPVVPAASVTQSVPPDSPAGTASPALAVKAAVVPVATAPVPATGLVATPSPTATTVATAASGAVAAAPASALRLEFVDRSWVEVRDASQKVVYSGEYGAGTRHAVEGRAPYYLWIGKASGVRVFAGERSIDLKPHTREEVARLTVE